MNFGRHGRTVMLAALFGSTSALVFGGMLPSAASASAGSINVSGPNGGGDHLVGTCVNITTANFSGTSLKAQFSGEGNTRGLGYDATVGVNKTTQIDLADAFSGVQYDAKEGAHVKVTIGGKSTTFWIADPTAGCGSAPAPTTAKAAPKHQPKAGNVASTTTTCSENSFLDTMSPAPGATVGAGSTVFVVYNDESPLYQPTLDVEFISSNQAVPSSRVTPDLPAGPPGKEKYSTKISYTLPNDLPDGTYSISIYAQDSDQNKPGGDCGRAVWAFNVSGGQTLPVTPPTTSTTAPAPTTTTTAPAPTTTTTAPKTTTTTAPKTTTTTAPPNGNASCTANGQLLGGMVTPTSINSGGGIGWAYQGTNRLDENSVVFMFGGNQVTPQLYPQTDGTIDIVYNTSMSTASGKYAASISVKDVTGQCASKNTTVTVTNPYGTGPT